MKKQLILSALIGGIIGSIAVMIVLLALNQSVPLKAQDLLSFIILVVSMVIAAFTILGASSLFTSWNDIDERSEKVFTKYQDRAERNIEKYGTQTKQEIIQEVNERQATLSQMTRQYTDHIAQAAKKGVKRQQRTLLLSLTIIVALMAVQYLREKFDSRKKQ
jgi:hypothetical protein